MGIKRKSPIATGEGTFFWPSSELYQVISEHCPDAIKTGEIKNQFGRKVAIDAYANLQSLVIVMFW